MFIKCRNDRGGYIWINVYQIKHIEGSYYCNEELANYYVTTVENKEYECADIKQVEEILNGKGKEV